jgi:putative transposase
MVRGLDRFPLFEDDRDRKAFIERLGTLVGDDKAFVYARVLLDNPVHLLFKSGVKGISHVMRKLLTAEIARDLGVNTSSITRAIERVERTTA